MPDRHSRHRAGCGFLSVPNGVRLVALLIGILSPIGIGASSVDVPVASLPIKDFLAGSSQKRFGKLEFVGGLVMKSPEPLFGAISSIRFRLDGRNFVAVLDTGHWMTGEIARDRVGALSGLSNVHIDAMLDRDGNSAKRKVDMDAEGLALRDGKAYVSYEQFHRIEVFPDTGFDTAKPKALLPYLIPNRELRRNGGIETLVAAPSKSPLAGAMVVVAEDSVDANGNLFAAILEGPRKGLFEVKREGSFAVTDGAFLPSGDLLLLERRFNFAEGVGMRIRRIHADAIKPGSLVDGDVLVEAGLSNQIDNMEAIDVVPQPDGSTHLIVVSDDNHSFLQRSIMLEFKILE